MTVQLIIFMVLACFVLDYLVRLWIRRLHGERERLEREKNVSTPVRLEFADEAASLQRIEAVNPKARILAVDDEKVVLDSYRRILGPEGYSIDTVQTGPEALSLVRRNDYDFVLTDLKMPDMDGVEVVRAVRNLRPDVDVVVITGYGTIETAVQTMAYGACEYLRKPFTADELAEYLERLRVKRQARLKAVRAPKVRVVRPSQTGDLPTNEDASQGGAFIAEGHTWAWLEPGGYLRIGIDDFANQAMGAIGEVLLPAPGLEVRCGEPLFSFRRGGETIRFPAPVSGKVLAHNENVAADPTLVSRSPCRDGWVCRMEPSDLARDLGELRIGALAQAWYGQEAVRLQAMKGAGPEGEPLAWGTLAQAFFTRETTRV